MNSLICTCCGERYSLRKFSRENPLINCGECGADLFLPYSRDDCRKGYKSLEHYEELLDLLPEHLVPHIPSTLRPQLSPFRKN